jgi:type I restriction enzyme M protein
MSNESSTIVQRLWNYCNVLRDDGVSYGDYVEQLTYLLFLKMADEQTRPPFNKDSKIPQGLDWQSLLSKDGQSWRFTIARFWSLSVRNQKCLE